MDWMQSSETTIPPEAWDRAWQLAAARMAARQSYEDLEEELTEALSQVMHLFHRMSPERREPGAQMRESPSSQPWRQRRTTLLILRSPERWEEEGGGVNTEDPGRVYAVWPSSD